jgi:hypothetical protein
MLKAINKFLGITSKLMASITSVERMAIVALFDGLESFRGLSARCDLGDPPFCVSRVVYTHPGLKFSKFHTNIIIITMPLYPLTTLLPPSDCPLPPSKKYNCLLRIF